jgi:hypothetical protein
MGEQTGKSSGQANDLDRGSDKDSDKDAASTRRETPRAIDNDPGADASREHQVEQEGALQRWETEGGAEDGREEGAEDRTDGHEVAEIRRTYTGEHAG